MCFYSIAGNSKNKNHEKQNIFSFFVLSLLLKNNIIIIIIIPKPIKVLKREKLGIGAISKGKKNFVKDSGIVRRFDKIGINPTDIILN